MRSAMATNAMVQSYFMLFLYLHRFMYSHLFIYRTAARGLFDCTPFVAPFCKILDPTATLADQTFQERKTLFQASISL